MYGLKASEVAQITALLGTVSAIWLLLRHSQQRKASTTGRSVDASNSDAIDTDPESTDPGLLKKFSEFKTYSTSRHTYKNLRIFYREHPQASRLPTTPAPLPLLVFIHGLGGSVAQFNPLLTSLSNISSCLAIDLPGCGMSEFENRDWRAYTTDALAELVKTVVEDYRDKEQNQGVLLLGHSMGCSLSALLASTTSPHSIAEHVVGFVAICPKATPPTGEQTKLFKRLLLVPGWIFDAWRRWDRRGGAESASVKRFVGADAPIELRQMQVRFNEQSRTPVWRRMASGTLPDYSSGKAVGGLPGKEVWSGIQVPVFLVGGEADHITKPEEVDIIAEFLGKENPISSPQVAHSDPVNDAAAPFDISKLESNDTSDATEDAGEVIEKEAPPADAPLPTHDATPESPEDIDAIYSDPSTPQEELDTLPPQPLRPKKIVKTTILPAPANHACLYMPSTSRTLAGLISDVLSSHVSPRLSLGWQLQFLSTAGKWDVKNLEKWRAVTPVSQPIGGVFRAMKTLREVDEVHNPMTFVEMYGREVGDVVDISHDQPVYDPRGLQRGGVRYHKFPTVSKIPPTDEEIRGFVQLVDRLREEQKSEHPDAKEKYIGVHCHYGFNRTGYFVVCYLVERLGFNVQSALEEFKLKRPNGIKHAHFMDGLYVRYCRGLRRQKTWME